MSTTKATTENGIDNRTLKAATGCMIVVPEGDGSGQFEVYSANNGVNKTYTVDLRAETCECPDHEHRAPAGGCKHIRRAKLSLGIMPVPVGVELDEALVHDCAKYGVDPEPAVNTPVSAGEHTASEAIATDGGQLLESEPVISGPHMEPAELSNATTFWRCEDCGRESIRKQDTERAAFHAAGCSQR